MSELLTGVWWFDAMALFGIVFLVLLVFGTPSWMFGSKLRWRRKDAADMAAHDERIAAFRRAGEADRP